MLKSIEKKSLIKTSLLALIVRIVGVLSAFLFHVIIARFLSIDEAGIFFLSFTIVTILWGVGSLGMPLTLVRFISTYQASGKLENINKVFTFAFIRVFFTSMLVVLLFFLIGKEFIRGMSLSVKLIEVLNVVIFSIPIIAISNLVAFSLQGLQKPLKSILIQNISTPFLVGFILVLYQYLSLDIEILNVAYTFLICTLVTLFMSLFLWYRKNKVAFWTSKDKSKQIEFINVSRSFYSISIIGLLMQWSGLLIVGAFSGEEEVALFSVAQRVAMLTSFVLIAINLVVAPKFSASFAKGNLSELKNLATFCNRIIWVVSIPILFFMLIFPEYLLGFFGEEYKKAALILQILVVGQFINMVTGSVGYLLNMTGNEKDMRNIALVLVPVTIFLGLILTYSFGIIGAAIATSVTVASQNLMAVKKVKQRLGFNVLKVF